MNCLHVALGCDGAQVASLPNSSQRLHFLTLFRQIRDDVRTIFGVRHCKEHLRSWHQGLRVSQPAIEVRLIPHDVRALQRRRVGVAGHGPGSSPNHTAMPGSDIVFINGMTAHAGLVDGLAVYGVPWRRVGSGEGVDRGARHDNHRHGDPGHAYVREAIDRTHVRCSFFGWLQAICQASVVSVNASDRGCACTNTLVTPSIRASWSPGTFSGPGPGPWPGAGCGYAVERAV